MNQVYITRSKAFRVVENDGQLLLQKAGFQGVWETCDLVGPFPSLARAKSAARFWAGS